MISWIIAVNVMRRTAADRKTFLAFIVLPPLLLSLLIGLFGASADEPVRVDTLNLDRGPLGGQVLDLLAAEPGYRLVPAGDRDTLQLYVTGGQAQAAIVIPEGFSGTPLTVELLQLRTGSGREGTDAVRKMRSHLWLG